MIKDYFEHYKRFKVVQLSILIVFSLAFFGFLYFDPFLKNNIFSNRNLLTICFFLWFFMIYSAITLIWDFRQIEINIIDNHYLHQAVFLDNLTGIPNRHSCDIVLDKYRSDNNISNLGLALISISNIEAINKSLGRSMGDQLIQDFSKALEKIGDKYGFVGRNGGNEYLAVFDNCSRGLMESFIREVEASVRGSDMGTNSIPISVSNRFVLNCEKNLESFADLMATLYQGR